MLFVISTAMTVKFAGQVLIRTVVYSRAMYHAYMLPIGYNEKSKRYLQHFTKNHGNMNLPKS